MRIIMASIVLAIASASAWAGDGLFWGAASNASGVYFFRADHPTPGASAAFSAANPVRYLRIISGSVYTLTPAERDAQDAAEAAAAAAAQAAAQAAAAIASSNAAIAAAIAYTNNMVQYWLTLTNSAHAFKALGAKYLPGFPTNTTWTYASAQAAFMAMPSGSQTLVQLWDNVFWQRSYIQLSDFFATYCPSTNADLADYNLKAYHWLWDFPGVK